MPEGTLEVLLVCAKGLENTDFLSHMDPYVLLTCRTQEQRSSVASGQGSEPQWNETFVFTVMTDEASELNLKIMDKDSFTNDDFVGEATIPLEALFIEGSLPPTVYRVVKDEEYRGEIRVGMTFTPEIRGGSQGCCDEEVNYGGVIESSREEESYGGWKESSREEEESYGGWKESSY
ncbi:hypothetical protein I3843_01G052100 [Carya illinoinensis]|uniref:C2 domain-containing protein n=1 Tax=Carya illinoinensis TaxID=32201 RepID=A0A8T1RLT4_CARIL|nr:elicitor-responsive protein 3-like isoform X2 [Carya illinoinensis]KAG6666781.1 hypothetical protein CIPAW_01G056000 [Carya illinoinensis]KAG7994306.1 hypothetical protein I3843_01G052100 [Carya illinoinensis]